MSHNKLFLLVQLYFAKIILFPVILNKTGKILKNAGKFGNYTSFITKPGKSWLMLKDSGYNYLSCIFARILSFSLYKGSLGN
jgi:hypothetical protein